MKIIRIDDLNTRFEILKKEIANVTNKIVDSEKLELESNKSLLLELSQKLKEQSDKVSQVADQSPNIAKDFRYSDDYCKLYDEYFAVNKEYALAINSYLQLMTDFLSSFGNKSLKLNRLRLETYNHQIKLLTHNLNDYSKNQIENNSFNKETIHCLIDNFGEPSFYNYLLEIER
jgi:uncharacterized coiled-coil protein SlyX